MLWHWNKSEGEYSLEWPNPQNTNCKSHQGKKHLDSWDNNHQHISRGPIKQMKRLLPKENKRPEWILHNAMHASQSRRPNCATSKLEKLHCSPHNARKIFFLKCWTHSGSDVHWCIYARQKRIKSTLWIIQLSSFYVRNIAGSVRVRSGGSELVLPIDNPQGFRTSLPRRTPHCPPIKCFAIYNDKRSIRLWKGPWLFGTLNNEARVSSRGYAVH